MEWSEVVVPALIGAAFPVILALIAVARWTGKLDRSIEGINLSLAQSGKDVSRLGDTVTVLTGKIYEIDAMLRERVSKLEGTVLHGELSRDVTQAVKETVIDLREEQQSSTRRED